jgi:hypothetical protein
MIADQPPVPQCVSSAANHSSTSVILSGASSDVLAFLNKIKQEKQPFELSLSAKNEHGETVAILQFSPETAWKTIASLIYNAQSAKLCMGGFTFKPQLCDANG